ncbi:unnamed protein product [Notodromas monacha]|uniref:Ig-like domain-containing protein n=1 Tax=Notodromas monacha TaxID=399045 RepID=A0A7R9BK75_9CRUS|nr:unnamed protein product [Notodromas monacha]CAG0916163.1 unnamed protein product [Notodromas monacha]
MSADGNITSSTLTFMPKVDDNGKTIKCLVRNEEIEHVVIEDSKKLDVHYVPKVEFFLGSKLDPKNIKVGDDVYFDCSIDANPSVFKTFFSLDGSILERGEGVVITNQTLVLQKIQRVKTGSYRCHAQNSQGEGQSEPVHLLVKYPPVCKENQQAIYGVALMEKVQISCQVEAEPAPQSFRWAFNISSEVLEVPEGHQMRPDPFRSVVSYETQTEFDYGTLLCWATNAIANQQTPCVFHILQTGSPEPLINCNFVNQTPTSLKVECQEGFDGGLPQLFIMELYTSEEKTLATNLTNDKPAFTAKGLQDGISYTVVLYAANSKGRSVTTTLETRTPKIMDVKKLDTGQGFTGTDRLTIFNPTVAAGIGVICLILVGVVVLLVVMTVRRCRTITTRSRPPKIVSSSQMNSNNVYKCERSSGDNDHDVVPLKAGTLLRVKGSDMNRQCTQVKTVTLGQEYSVLSNPPPGSCATLPFPVSSRTKSLNHIPEQIDYQLPPPVPDVDGTVEMGGYIYGNEQMWLKDQEPLSPPESFLTPCEAANHAQHHNQHYHQVLPTETAVVPEPAQADATSRESRWH